MAGAAYPVGREGTVSMIVRITYEDGSAEEHERFPRSERRAVVTGGAGFLGSHLVAALLSAGWSVVVVDDFSSGSRDNLPFCGGDSALTVITSDICAEWKVDEPVDVVFNFAAPAEEPATTAPLPMESGAV